MRSFNPLASRATDRYRYSDADILTIRSAGVRSPQSAASTQGPTHACAKASDFFCDDRLQHRLVQTQISHNVLQLAILFFQLSQPPQFRRTQVLVLLAPQIKGRLANTHLPAHLIHRRAQLRLLQRKGDLVFAELAPLHDMTSFSSNQKSCRNSVTKRYCFLGQGQGTRLSPRSEAPGTSIALTCPASPDAKGLGVLTN